MIWALPTYCRTARSLLVWLCEKRQPAEVEWALCETFGRRATWAQA